MKIDQLTNAEKAKIFRAEAAHQCDLAAEWYNQQSMMTGDSCMNNAASLMRIAAECERRDHCIGLIQEKKGPRHD